MGMKLSDLAPHLQDRVRQEIAMQATAKAARNREAALAQEYVAGELTLWAPGDPPTVTHQAKHIEFRKGKPTIRDDDRLRAARSHYAAFFGHNPDRAKLAGPIEARIQVRFAAADGPPAWWTKKPDADNAAKAVLDAAQAAGFLSDEMVSILVVEKLGISKDEPADGRGVLLTLRTLERKPTLAKVPHNRGRIVPIV